MPGVYSGKTVPIKVKIGLRPNGHADHPDWNQLPLAKAGQTPEDHMCGGWIYDKKCGHQEEDAESPLGMQWGILMVSEDFADEAVATFPGIVTIMTNEVELESFIESRCTIHLPEYRYDNEELTALKTERDLLTALGQPTIEIDAKITKALDPDDDTPGKRRQKGKLWEDVKKERGVKLSDRMSKKPKV